jgi:hypothetical protein
MIKKKRGSGSGSANKEEAATAASLLIMTTMTRTTDDGQQVETRATGGPHMMYDRHELLAPPAAKILRMLQLAPAHNPMGEERYFTPDKEQPENGQQGTTGKMVAYRILPVRDYLLGIISLEIDDLYANMPCLS